MPRLALLPALLALVASLFADPLPSPLFSDGAVLQQGRAVPVWGNATPGERITVSFAGAIVSTTTGSDGSWMVLLPPLAPSSEPADLQIAGNATKLVHGVLVGEVWLCAGGSGMDWPLQTPEPVAATLSSTVPSGQLRLFHIPSSRNQDSISAWQGTPLTHGSAIAQHFGEELNRRLKVPIGLIQLSCPGSAIEAWMSPVAFGYAPGLAGAAGEFWQRLVQEFPARQASYKRAEADWQSAAEKAKKRGAANYNFFLKKNPEPRPPLGPEAAMEPSSLVSPLLNPTLPYAIRGVLWYQGEGNAHNSGSYKRLFTSFIQALRTHFGAAELPFVFVQAPAISIPDDPSSRCLAELRKAQEETSTLPFVGMAVGIDQASPNSLKGNDRQEIARRLVLVARKVAYGQACDSEGPRPVTAHREGKALILKFSHADAGLIAIARPVQSLELAGQDQVYHPATATIRGDSLLISSPQVATPVSVRYAWSNAPVANLFNGASLPAAPFSFSLTP
jgi:sialate O-acetylesterase